MWISSLLGRRRRQRRQQSSGMEGLQSFRVQQRLWGQRRRLHLAHQRDYAWVDDANSFVTFKWQYNYFTKWLRGDVDIGCRFFIKDMKPHDYFIKSFAILAHTHPKTKIIALVGRNNVKFAQSRLIFSGETTIVSNKQVTICQWWSSFCGFRNSLNKNKWHKATFYCNAKQLNAVKELICRLVYIIIHIKDNDGHEVQMLWLGFNFLHYLNKPSTAVACHHRNKTDACGDGRIIQVQLEALHNSAMQVDWSLYCGILVSHLNQLFYSKTCSNHDLRHSL